MKLKPRLKSNTMGYLMLAPALILLVLLVVYPLAAGICYSFTDYMVLSKDPVQFTGLQNYVELFTEDRNYFSVLGWTITQALCSVLLAYVTGLGIAMLLNSSIKGRGMFRSLVLLPWIISMAVAAQNWKWLFNDRYGIINRFLLEVGLIEEPLIFLGNMDLVKPTIIVISAWKSIPFMVIIILAALQGIPQDQYESADLDGATSWQKFRYITLPSLKSVTVMCTSLMFIWSFNSYEGIALLTGGGPGKFTNTLAVYTYKMAFHENRLGYASAISVVVMIILVTLALIRQKISVDDDD